MKIFHITTQHIYFSTSGPRGELWYSHRWGWNRQKMAKIDFTYTLANGRIFAAAHPMSITFSQHYRVLDAFNGINNRKTNLNACWKAARVGIYGRAQFQCSVVGALWVFHSNTRHRVVYLSKIGEIDIAMSTWYAMSHTTSAPNWISCMGMYVFISAKKC